MQKRMEGATEAHEEETWLYRAGRDRLGLGLEMLPQELIEHMQCPASGCSQSLIPRRKVGESWRRMDPVSIV